MPRELRRGAYSARQPWLRRPQSPKWAAVLLLSAVLLLLLLLRQNIASNIVGLFEALSPSPDLQLPPSAPPTNKP